MNQLFEKDFKPVGFWAPRTALNFAVRPRLWRQVLHAPVSIRFEESEWSQHPSVARWTYSQRSQKNRLQITFTSEYFYKLFSYRWRAVSDALSLLIEQHPNITFTDVPVDISDCVDASVPENTFRFTKLPSDPHDLIPNPFLLEHRRAPQHPIKWEHKKDSLYFRGALTGQLQSFENSRVAACVAAQEIPESDCKLSMFPQTPETFIHEIKLQNLCGSKDSEKALNRHRYLLDIDGNASSWHRFWLIGTFGCVPIRFESKWLEYWHEKLEEGVNYLYADRETLIDVVDSLRKQPERATSVAQNASEFVSTYLSPNSAQKSFNEAWLNRTH